jgi:hypothetical protein
VLAHGFLDLMAKLVHTDDFRNPNEQELIVGCHDRVSVSLTRTRASWRQLMSYQFADRIKGQLGVLAEQQQEIEKTPWIPRAICYALKTATLSYNVSDKQSRRRKTWISRGSGENADNEGLVRCGTHRLPSRRRGVQGRVQDDVRCYLGWDSTARLGRPVIHHGDHELVLGLYLLSSQENRVRVFDPLLRKLAALRLS